MVLFCIAWHGFSIECHCCPLQTRKANKSHTHCTTLETKLHRFKVSVSVSMKHIESWHRKIPQWQQALGPWPQKNISHTKQQRNVGFELWIALISPETGKKHEVRCSCWHYCHIFACSPRCFQSHCKAPTILGKETNCVPSPFCPGSRS